jgi:DNA/RNA endonuclease YhcR with UshA esterase domain
MRLLAGVIAVVFVSVGVAEEKKNKPLTPAEAIKKVDEKVTVEMVVQASKNRLEKFKEIYLDSELDFKDDKNLAVVITETGAAKYKDAGIDEPASHFKGKTIRVTGMVTLKEKRPRIEVNDPKQIEEVK